MTNVTPKPSTCADCGAPLSAGACPACAFQLLLHGVPPPENEAVAKDEIEALAQQGRYTLKRRLAAGGMGVVYEAEDHKLKRTVALKMIRGSTFANAAEVARFTIEAEAAAALDHPNIVPIYEIGQLEGQPFFTMKLIEGQSLAERMKQGLLPTREAVSLLSLIARAVQHAHQRGVLHRDLKPGNILLDAVGKPSLTDFGLAKLTQTDASLTLTTDHLGTPHYMAPEVANGTARAASTASDVWALGVLLWEMLCGSPPFGGGGAVEIMRRIVNEEPVWPIGSRGDGDLLTIARRCLEKQPTRRPTSAGDVADELDRWLRGEPIKARPVTSGERLLKWIRRKPTMAALYAVLLAGMMASLFLWQRSERAVVSLTQTNSQLETSLRLATATKLAGDARMQIDESPSRALMLAVESVEMMEHTEQGVLPESASALTAVLQQVGGLDASVFGAQAIYNDGYVRLTAAYGGETVNISPDGRWLLSVNFMSGSSQELEAGLFDLRDPLRVAPVRRWELWPRLQYPEHPVLCWLPDSQRVLFLSNEGDVVVWELAVPESAGASPPLSHRLAPLTQPAMKFQNLRLQSHSAGGPRKLLLTYLTENIHPELYWTLTEISTDGQISVPPLRKFPSGYAQNSTPHLSPDGGWILMRGDNRAAVPVLFDLHGAEPVQVAVPGGERFLLEAIFSPDERKLVFYEGGGQLRLLELPGVGGTVLSADRKIFTQDGALQDLAFSPNSEWLAMTGQSGAVTMVPMREGQSEVLLHLSGGDGWAVGFSPDGRWLVAGGDRRLVDVWSVEGISNGAPAREFRGLPSAVVHAGFSPDMQRMFAVGAGFAVRHWPFDFQNRGSSLPVQMEAGNFFINEVAVSPDQQWLASACQGRRRAGEHLKEGFVTLSQIGGKVRGTLDVHANFASSVAFSWDGKWLASTGLDGNVKVWDAVAVQQAITAGLPSPAPRFELPMTETRLEYERFLAFHPRGTLYCVCGDGVLFAWDLTTSDPASTGQDYGIHSIAYLLPDAEVSPDGKWLAVARHGWDSVQPDSDQHDNQVLLFDVSQPGPPKYAMALQANFLEQTTLSISADSRWLAAGAAGKQPTVWDLKSNDLPASMRLAPVSTQLTAGVGFSPDGKWLAIGGNDGLLHLWDWRVSNQLRTIQCENSIRSLAWLADGRIFTAGNSNFASLWDTDIPRLKALARRTAGRELSPSERARFRVRPEK